MNSQDENNWEDGFVKFGFDASVGRLFRGIIHNLNGVGQAFSMQAELLQMMFVKADDVLEKIGQATSLEEAQENSVKLREMMRGRAGLAKHLTGEVEVLRETMKRAALLAQETSEPSGGNSFKLDSVIATEMEFLKSDSFFKHKINKELLLADNIDDLEGCFVEVHQILGALLENASQALAANIDNESSPGISVATATDGENAEIRVTDNGPGIDSGDLENIFEPFFTTRENHQGLGLYMARVMAVASGGTLTCESSPGRTCFVLRIPIRGGKA